MTYQGPPEPIDRPMSRLALRSTVQPRVIARLAAAHAAVGQAQRRAVEKAREAGAILLSIDRYDRKAATAAVGISQRTGQVYMQIARGWDQLKAQPSALSSINAALAALNPKPEPEFEVHRVDLGHAGASAEVVKVLSSLRGRAVRLEVKVRRSRREPDPTQPTLF